MPESYTTSGSYKVPVPGENRMIAQLSKTSFFFSRFAVAVVVPHLGAQGEIFRYSVLRRGAPRRMSEWRHVRRA